MIADASIDEIAKPGEGLRDFLLHLAIYMDGLKHEQLFLLIDIHMLNLCLSVMLLTASRRWFSSC